MWFSDSGVSIYTYVNPEIHISKEQETDIINYIYSFIMFGSKDPEYDKFINMHYTKSDIPVYLYRSGLSSFACVVAIGFDFFTSFPDKERVKTLEICVAADAEADNYD